MHMKARKDNVMHAIKLYRKFPYKKAMLKAKQHTRKMDKNSSIWLAQASLQCLSSMFPTTSNVSAFIVSQLFRADFLK